MNCILLFDIDGTLVSRATPGRSAGLRAMNKAAEVMTGTNGLANRITFAGATDLDVARQLLEMGGVRSPNDSKKRELLAQYVLYMREYIKEDKYAALGEPHTIIPKLRQMGATIGLGTGNIKEGAHAKLQSAGIDGLFDIDLGGYGEDAETRADILNTAVQRCLKMNPRNDGLTPPIVVIGDTQKDVDAAKAINAFCIGVPFDKSTSESLLQGGADASVDTINEQLIQTITKMCKQNA